TVIASKNEVDQSKPKNRGSSPKGYASIAAPSASYAVGILPGLGISAADAADRAWLTIKTLVNLGRRKLVSLGRWLTSPIHFLVTTTQSDVADEPRFLRKYSSNSR